jgi:hypothetical protein
LEGVNLMTFEVGDDLTKSEGVTDELIWNVGLDVVGEVEFDHGWCANSDLFAHRLAVSETTFVDGRLLSTDAREHDTTMAVVVWVNRLTDSLRRRSLMVSAVVAATPRSVCKQ